MTRKKTPSPLDAKSVAFKPRKGDLRRLEIIQSAVRCLATTGIDRTTFESVGKPIRMSKAHVAYYFPDLSDLVEAAIKWVVSTIQDRTVQYVTSRNAKDKTLQAFIEATFESFHDSREFAPIILLFYYLSSHQERYRRLHSEIRQMGASRIEVILSSMIKPENHHVLTPLAKLVQSILTGNLVDFYTTDSPVSFDTLKKRTVNQIHDVVQMMSKNQPKLR